MDMIEATAQHLESFRQITGNTMKVHSEYKPGLLESAYEAAMEYLQLQGNHRGGVRQKLLPIYWKDVRLEQTYRMDMVVNNTIVELQAVKHTTDDHIHQL